MKLKSLFIAAFSLLALSQVACAESSTPVKATNLKEGSDYVVIEGTKGINKPEIIEFFSYHCPACYNMEGFLHNWLPQKSEKINFKRVPVFMGNMPHLTQGYYAAEVLGVVDKVHLEIFNTWHRDKNVIRSKRDLYPVFAKAGVSQEDFDKAYNSFAVANKVQHAKKMVRDFKVLSFPRFVVNQKYEVKIQSGDQLATVLNELPIEKSK